MDMSKLIIGTLIFSGILLAMGTSVNLMADNYGVTQTENISTLSKINETRIEIEQLTGNATGSEIESGAIGDFFGLITTAAVQTGKLLIKSPQILIGSISEAAGIAGTGVIPDWIVNMIIAIILIVPLVVFIRILVKVNI